MVSRSCWCGDKKLQNPTNAKSPVIQLAKGRKQHIKQTLHILRRGIFTMQPKCTLVIHCSTELNISTTIRMTTWQVREVDCFNATI